MTEVLRGAACWGDLPKGKVSKVNCAYRLRTISLVGIHRRLSGEPVDAGAVVPGSYL